MGLKEKLREVVSEFILDLVVGMFESDELHSVEEVKELFHSVAYLYDSPRIAESDYKIAYSKGYKAGIQKGAPWATQEQVQEALESHLKESYQDTFGFLTKELGTRCAFLEGFYYGKTTGDWYSINKDQPTS